MSTLRDVGVAWARRPWAWVVLGVLLLAVVVALLRFAPLFSVERVTVSGNDQVSTQDVLAAAAVAPGTRVLTAPLQQIAARIETLDAVAGATVTRDWPNTLHIVVRERRPVGYVKLDGGVGLVGSDGTVYRTDAKAPSDLPQLPGAPVAGVGDPYSSRLDAAGEHAFEVAKKLPHALQRSIASITTDAQGSVSMTSDDDVTVLWGSADANREKAQVVLLLMQRRSWGTQVTTVNVSAPRAPALD